MVTYIQIRNDLSTATLEDLEIESSSRSYNGYTLLMKHYYYHLGNEDNKSQELIVGFESIMILHDSSTSVSTEEESSITTNFSESLSIGERIINKNYHQNFYLIYGINLMQQSNFSGMKERNGLIYI